MDQALTTGSGCLWGVRIREPRLGDRARRCRSRLAVIARESGRSSIPETPVLEPRSLGLLDRPVAPGDDSGELARAVALTG